MPHPPPHSCTTGTFSTLSTDAESLSGGVHDVLRVGATVRRPTGPWSPLVHDLLRHIRAEGFTGAPGVRGTADDGRTEILDFLPGEAGTDPAAPAVTSLTALESAAALLRAYHDSTAGYASTAPREGWLLPAREPAEVICHGDFAPYNCVLDSDRVVGVFDFDTAHPAPRLWDLAYAVYRWAPLTAPGSPDARGTTEEQAVRARVFCDGYDLSAADRAALPDTVAERLHAMVAFMRAQAAAGHPSFARHLAEGHHEQYLGDAAYIRARREVFEHHLRGAV
ncbi:phosphotransferase enzyme family protein [Streptomyces yaizuensis]|uniref:Aminoglycoside phosphotransferase family protein n=1 Tax=Streptomyces yaizuensis TaxID=2989713 RepID=A0ABQ5P061_9ACTN|nr:aminoglycoside phosphotransferase family protein [Streptomyces sp. YSPA8]GLF95828.1 aminoglycoside phosphotransferase family protein [Streptomyces sp. YSPA8]